MSVGHHPKQPRLTRIKNASVQLGFPLRKSRKFQLAEPEVDITIPFQDNTTQKAILVRAYLDSAAVNIAMSA